MKFIISMVVFVIACYVFISDDEKSPNGTKGAVTEKTPVKKTSKLDELISAEEDKISPDGELAGLFNLGSDGTDLQRSEALKVLKGKVVKWNLTVYEIVEVSDGKYRVSTDSGVDVKMVDRQIKFFSKEVSAVIIVSASSDEDKKKMLGFKTGSKICIKGKLTGDTSFRMLEINPAVLCSNA